ncbi:MAG TPA: GtrA family protein [Bacilli bacterium]|nr:GtrA family protein [Bacilli bacterium]
MINRCKELYNKYSEIINYLIVGVLTTIVSYVTYLFAANILFPAKGALDIQISNIISWICAVLFAYYTNKKYVFKTKTVGKEKYKEMVNFFESRILTLLVDMGMMYVMVTLSGINDAIAKLIVQVVITVLNYLLSKILVFNKKNK